MSTFIKTLEDEFVRETKIAKQRQIMNSLFDAQNAENQAKRKAEVWSTNLANYKMAL